MTWGVELWDQYDNLGAHTQRGIDFLDKYGQFIKDRCSIEGEYASKLRRLVKNYQPKKKEEEDYQFSSCKAFLHMLNEVGDMAGQHELIAENMTTQIVKEINNLVKEFKDERKRHLHEGSKLQAQLQASLAHLDKAKKAYEKAFREAEKAQENFSKADADLNLSRAEVEKARTLSVMKNQTCEDCKTEYANQLQKTNELQRQHYSTTLPKVFQQLQDMDERRITFIQNFIKLSADIQRHVFPIVNKCLDGIVKASETVDPKQDSRLVIERFKSGFSPPEDYPFEDLSNLKNSEGNTSLHSVPSFKAETIKGTITAGKLKKRGGIFGIFSSNKHHIDETKEDYSDLPPNQRKKKLTQKIEHIQNQIQQETAARDGLIKMKLVYEQNPAMGDPLSVEGQLTESGHKLEKLQVELQKFQNYLSEAEHMTLTPTSHKKDRNSLSEDSLSRSASDSSVNNPNNNKILVSNTPPQANGPESGISTSHTSIPEVDVYADAEEFDNIEEENVDFDLEPLPVLGTARALYPFDAQSEGSIPMEEGEEFEVVELDQGDGWTRVRRGDVQEGFVPTTYLQCFLYNNC
ncbi:formin-binding protein 1 homolog isoform X4 [Limulus polyphemus]|uniref:Formin-binding protein 1 homolog isoform X4 n=1 Tax=Limulus polyphemus TaxID=6850 RepID=A0ABM1BKS3_LIMPO|nr:formin-binding protein 1 homolog isoform X4 [Limulus polyphemus]